MQSTQLHQSMSWTLVLSFRRTEFSGSSCYRQIDPCRGALAVLIGHFDDHTPVLYIFFCSRVCLSSTPASKSSKMDAPITCAGWTPTSMNPLKVAEMLWSFRKTSFRMSVTAMPPFPMVTLPYCRASCTGTTKTHTCRRLPSTCVDRCLSTIAHNQSWNFDIYTYH